MYSLFANSEVAIMVYIEVLMISFECTLTKNDVVTTYTTHQSRINRGNYLLHHGLD